MQDPDVPWAHAMTLVEHLAGDCVTLSLIKDGDHRLSRDEDIAALIAAVSGIA
jgi:dipeptidyl aminopeptidase/acylaminoacyl peptidase